MYGTGENAESRIIRKPYFANIVWAVANCEADAKLLIIHIPTESNSHIPIIYEIAPPTIDPKDVAKNTGKARRLSATIGGAMKTSGGMNKNMESNTVRIKTTQRADLCADFCKSHSCNFILSRPAIVNYLFVFYNDKNEEKMSYKIDEKTLVLCEKVFGLEMQKLMVVEEMGELIQEIIKNMRGHENRPQIIAEMADVRNMFEQLQHIYSISDEELDDARKAKIERTQERMNKIQRKDG